MEGGKGAKKNKHMKNTLKKIIFTSALLGSFTFSFAQKIDTKAKDILEAVSVNYKAKKNLYFKFTYGTGTGKLPKQNPASSTLLLHNTD